MSARKRTVAPGPLERVAARPWPPMERWMVNALNWVRWVEIARAVDFSWKESSGWAWKCLSVGS